MHLFILKLWMPLGDQQPLTHLSRSLLEERQRGRDRNGVETETEMEVRDRDGGERQRKRKRDRDRWGETETAGETETEMGGRDRGGDRDRGRDRDRSRTSQGTLCPQPSCSLAQSPGPSVGPLSPGPPWTALPSPTLFFGPQAEGTSLFGPIEVRGPAGHLAYEPPGVKLPSTLKLSRVCPLNQPLPLQNLSGRNLSAKRSFLGIARHNRGRGGAGVQASVPPPNPGLACRLQAGFWKPVPGVPTFAPTHLHREQICTERLQFLVPSDERLAIQRRREMKYSLLFGRQLLPPQDSWIRVIIDLIFLLISSSRRYHLHSQGQGTARGQPSGCGACWHLRVGHGLNHGCACTPPWTDRARPGRASRSAPRGLWGESSCQGVTAHPHSHTRRPPGRIGGSGPSLSVPVS